MKVPSKKEKGLMDVVNSVVTAEGRGISGINGNGENIIKNNFREN